MTRYVVALTCPDARGIAAAVSGFLAENHANIVEAHHFHEGAPDRFFLRAEFTERDGPLPPLAALKSGFAQIAERFRMDWQMVDAAAPQRVLIAVSRFGHCLYDLLHRVRAGSLNIEVPAVVSNHDDMRSFVEWNGIPYHHLPVDAASKARQEDRLLDIVEDQRIDLVVLARYMQVLSPRLCEALAGRCINIHHSFLPGFKGAKPYHQAYERGVKIIGATSHYVTGDLDEGPIIEQAVERVDHGHTPERLVEVGRDLESMVLARAVRWHAERRIMLSGGRTIVFR